MYVWLAWYHDGFMDSSPELLAVCSTQERAEEVQEKHQNDSEARWHEYKNHATWKVKCEEVLE